VQHRVLRAALADFFACAQARNRALHQGKQAAEDALEAHRREHSEQHSRMQRAQQVCDQPALPALQCVVSGWHALTIAAVLQGLDEEVRVLKGSLDAAENSKAAAEHQLQTVKSNNTDLEVRRSKDILALKEPPLGPRLRGDHICLMRRAGMRF